ncbi:MAG: hypothetical protein HND55_04380 [Pseudomonadota bacterium]|nr:MAG: hypothetical protein HND55_04380 [Pseudomonadota bacterium]
MSGRKIFAHIRTDQPRGYQPTDTPGYYYMFTGGYPFDYAHNTIGAKPVGDDDGPAGEVKLSDRNDSWTIKVKDHTGQGFKIVRWNLGEENIPGIAFDPAPNADIELSDKIKIDASNVPSGHHGAWDGYTVTLASGDGTRVKLDPRIYDVRE